MMMWRSLRPDAVYRVLLMLGRHRSMRAAPPALDEAVAENHARIVEKPVDPVRPPA